MVLYPSKGYPWDEAKQWVTQAFKRADEATESKRITETGGRRFDPSLPAREEWIFLLLWPQTMSEGTQRP